MSTEVIENLIAQVEASKQMYNESLNQLFTVRTHNVTLQRKLQEINAKLTEIEKSKTAEVNATPVCDEPDAPALELENLSA